MDLPSLRERLARGVAEGRFEAETEAEEAAAEHAVSERPAWAIIDWDALEAEAARRHPPHEPVSNAEPGDLEQTRMKDSRADAAMAAVESFVEEAMSSQAVESSGPSEPFKPEIVGPGESRTSGESTELSRVPKAKRWCSARSWSGSAPSARG